MTVDGVTADADSGEMWVVTKNGEKVESVATEEFKDGDKYIIMFSIE